MPEKRPNYSKKIEELLSTMPSFVSDFIYNFGSVDMYNTKLEYCRDIKKFLDYLVIKVDYFKDKDIKEITLSEMENIDPLDINKYLTFLAINNEKERKNTTIKRKRATLSSMYSFFEENKKISKNPVACTRKINIPEKNLIYLTNEEQTVLLNTVRYGTNLPKNTAKVHNNYEYRDSAMFLLMLDTGLRVSEMLNTDLSDYNIKECSVTVKRKGGDEQIIYYSDECGECLDLYFNAQRTKYNVKHDEELPAFTTLSGKRLGVRAVEVLVKKYVSACMPDKAKVITPHKLRSSFAMSFYNATNNDLLLLKERLNHKNIATTNIYAKACDTHVRASRNALQGMR